jgi:pimeloyl-ACP methyl ester carboxylesterase
MKRLGHEKFMYQGGDWGAIIGTAVSVVYPERVLGFHTNYPSFRLNARDYVKLLIADYYPALVYDHPGNESQIFSLTAYAKFVLKESGYFHIQATYPDTVGYGLNDSPAGLAAYILEKFRDPLLKTDAQLNQLLSYDELLTNVMIYWINNCMTSAARFYKEQMAVFGESYIIKVPYAADTGKFDIPTPPLSIIKKKATNIIHYRKTEKGGHFLAFEQPLLLAEAIHDFALKVLQGKQ